MPDDKRLAYSVSEVLELLPVGRSTLYQMIADGQLPALKVGTHWIISREAIDRFLSGRSA